MRLDKFLAHNGFGTRKQVRILIKKGAVYVNENNVKDHGHILNLDTDSIRVYDETINYVRNTYMMLNKPQGYISSTESNLYPSVLELVESYRSDLIIVGRLDVDTEGLLLITNDGNFAHNISHGKKEVYKQYLVTLEKDFDLSFIKDIEAGLTLSDGTIKPAHIEVIEPRLIKLDIAEGKFHQVKRMMHACENEVLHLKRIKIGNLELDDTLQPGAYRELTEEELNNIN